MDFFICTNVFIPLRSAPSHRSEMVSQVLFGERLHILESSGTWLRIETDFDSYKGWIDNSQGGYIRCNETESGIITGREMICIREDGSRMILAPGSELFDLNGDFSSFRVGNESFQLPQGNAQLFAPSATITETALQFMNTPYLWGGRTPWGIDCSGLVQIVCKIHGIALPRDAASQSENGIMVNFFGEALTGDILFFSGDTDNISHTGILLAPGRVIHASGRVRVDTIDHQGIWRDDLGKYTHRLRVIKRIL